MISSLPRLKVTELKLILKGLQIWGYAKQLKADLVNTLTNWIRETPSTSSVFQQVAEQMIRFSVFSEIEYVSYMMHNIEILIEFLVLVLLL